MINVKESQGFRRRVGQVGGRCDLRWWSLDVAWIGEEVVCWRRSAGVQKGGSGRACIKAKIRTWYIFEVEAIIEPPVNEFPVTIAS
jgi:hypothetical protein